MAKAEILPPVDDTAATDADDGLEDERVKVPSGRSYRARLVTTGNIKTELGKVYRAFRNGKINGEVAAISERLLRGMLKATEQEHAFLLATEDPDADRPALAGLVLIGPGENKTDGDPVLHNIIEEAVEKYSTSQHKEKSNGRQKDEEANE